MALEFKVDVFESSQSVEKVFGPKNSFWKFLAKNLFLRSDQKMIEQSQKLSFVEEMYDGETWSRKMGFMIFFSIYFFIWLSYCCDDKFKKLLNN